MFEVCNHRIRTVKITVVGCVGLHTRTVIIVGSVYGRRVIIVVGFVHA